MNFIRNSTFLQLFYFFKKEKNKKIAKNIVMVNFDVSPWLDYGSQLFG